MSVFAAAGVCVAGAAGAATLPGIGTFVGSAGVGTANGDVGPSPVGESYVYVTTARSTATGLGLEVGDETNGSELTTNAFAADQGQLLTWYFNYVTSDGQIFTDYAYARLVDAATSGSLLMFTARTTPTGDTVPGFDLPPIDGVVSLDPASSAIIPGATTWNELGVSSGECYIAVGEGCGSTGWIKATFEIPETSVYFAVFGVVNWSDSIFDSGLAVAGLRIGDTPIIPDDPSVIPLPATVWLALSGVAALVGVGRRRSTA